MASHQVRLTTLGICCVQRRMVVPNFVTFDKNHILNKRVEIKSKLGFEAVTPTECLEELFAYLS